MLGFPSPISRGLPTSAGVGVSGDVMSDANAANILYQFAVPSANSSGGGATSLIAGNNSGSDSAPGSPPESFEGLGPSDIVGTSVPASGAGLLGANGHHDHTYSLAYAEGCYGLDEDRRHGSGGVSSELSYGLGHNGVALSSRGRSFLSPTTRRSDQNSGGTAGKSDQGAHQGFPIIPDLNTYFASGESSSIVPGGQAAATAAIGSSSLAPGAGFSTAGNGSPLLSSAIAGNTGALAGNILASASRSLSGDSMDSPPHIYDGSASSSTRRRLSESTSTVAAPAVVPSGFTSTMSSSVGGAVGGFGFGNTSGQHVQGAVMGSAAYAPTLDDNYDARMSQGKYFPPEPTLTSPTASTFEAKPAPATKRKRESTGKKKADGTASTPRKRRKTDQTSTDSPAGENFVQEMEKLYKDKLSAPLLSTDAPKTSPVKQPTTAKKPATVNKKKKPDTVSDGSLKIKTEEGVQQEEDWDGEAYVTRCVCGYTHNDDFMIQCDNCEVWQHGLCVGVNPKKVPESYACELCNLRYIDKAKARRLQKKKRSELELSDSDSDIDEKPKTSKPKLPSKKEDGSKKQALIKSPSSPDSGQFADQYEQATRNIYSTKVLQAVASNRSTASNASLLDHLSVRLCDVLYVEAGRPGLVATRTVPPDQPIIEYRGRFWVQSQYDGRDEHGRMNPFVLLYHDLDHADMCVDARTYGNPARFVRRSCQPNATVKHVISGNYLHVLLVAVELVERGSEISIPFDFDFRQSKYPVECACNQSNCVVQLHNRSLPEVVEKKRGVARNALTKGSSRTPRGRPKKSQSEDESSEAGQSEKKAKPADKKQQPKKSAWRVKLQKAKDVAVRNKTKLVTPTASKPKSQPVKKSHRKSVDSSTGEKEVAKAKPASKPDVAESADESESKKTEKTTARKPSGSGGKITSQTKGIDVDKKPSTNTMEEESVDKQESREAKKLQKLVEQIERMEERKKKKTSADELDSSSKATDKSASVQETTKLGSTEDNAASRAGDRRRRRLSTRTSSQSEAELLRPSGPETSELEEGGSAGEIHTGSRDGRKSSSHELKALEDYWSKQSGNTSEDWLLPDERRKMSREERKMQELLARFERLDGKKKGEDSQSQDEASSTQATAIAAKTSAVAAKTTAVAPSPKRQAALPSARASPPESASKVAAKKSLSKAKERQSQTKPTSHKGAAAKTKAKLAAEKSKMITRRKLRVKLSSSKKGASSAKSSAVTAKTPPEPKSSPRKSRVEKRNSRAASKRRRKRTRGATKSAAEVSSSESSGSGDESESERRSSSSSEDERKISDRATNGNFVRTKKQLASYRARERRQTTTNTSESEHHDAGSPVGGSTQGGRIAPGSADNETGSAKKRWLRQVLSESGTDTSVLGSPPRDGRIATASALKKLAAEPMETDESGLVEPEAASTEDAHLGTIPPPLGSRMMEESSKSQTPTVNGVNSPPSRSQPDPQIPHVVSAGSLPIPAPSLPSAALPPAMPVSMFGSALEALYMVARQDDPQFSEMGGYGSGVSAGGLDAEVMSGSVIVEPVSKKKVSLSEYRMRKVRDLDVDTRDGLALATTETAMGGVVSSVSPSGVTSDVSVVGTEILSTTTAALTVVSTTQAAANQTTVTTKGSVTGPAVSTPSFIPNIKDGAATLSRSRLSSLPPIPDLTDQGSLRGRSMDPRAGRIGSETSLDDLKERIYAKSFNRRPTTTNFVDLASNTPASREISPSPTDAALFPATSGPPLPPSFTDQSPSSGLPRGASTEEDDERIPLSERLRMEFGVDTAYDDASALMESQSTMLGSLPAPPMAPEISGMLPLVAITPARGAVPVPVSVSGGVLRPLRPPAPSGPNAPSVPSRSGSVEPGVPGGQMVMNAAQIQQHMGQMLQMMGQFMGHMMEASMTTQQVPISAPLSVQAPSQAPSGSGVSGGPLSAGSRPSPGTGDPTDPAPARDGPDYTRMMFAYGAQPHVRPSSAGSSPRPPFPGSASDSTRWRFNNR